MLRNLITMPTIDHFDLKSKKDMHWKRKIWHAVGISIMAAIHMTQSNYTSWIILAVLAILIIPGDVARQWNEKVNYAAHKIFGPVMRKSESNSISGTTFLILGAAILLLFFNPDVINIALFFLALADPIASYSGIKYGKEPLMNGKTLQGFIAAFVVCSIVIGFYCYFANILVERLWIIVPAGGLIGAASELITIKSLDDNLSFPVLSAVGISAMFYIFGAI